MSVARKVLMIIAFVVSLLGLLVLASCTAVFFIATNNEDVLVRVLDSLSKRNISFDNGKLLVTIIGVIFAIMAFIILINACLSIKGAKSNRSGLMVLNIIFGFISGIYINSLGGIFGLVESKKE